jgi:hypothetical protein
MGSLANQKKLWLLKRSKELPSVGSQLLTLSIRVWICLSRPSNKVGLLEADVELSSYYSTSSVDNLPQFI